MKSNFLTTVITGATGLGVSEAVDVATSIDPTPIQEGATLFTQLVILVVTIINLFKRKKSAVN